MSTTYDADIGYNAVIGYDGDEIAVVGSGSMTVRFVDAGRKRKMDLDLLVTSLILSDDD